MKRRTLPTLDDMCTQLAALTPCFQVIDNLVDATKTFVNGLSSRLDALQTLLDHQGAEFFAS